MLKVIGFSLMNGVGFYWCFVYITTWLHQVAGVSQPMTLLLNSIGLAMMMVMTPLIGAASDRIGRKPVLLLGAVGLVLLAVPLFMLAGHGSVAAIILAQLGFGFCIGCYAGAGPAFVVEAFPK